MSYRHLGAVWAADIEPPALKLVAATLADRANDEGGGIRFSVQTIAWRANLSERQARRYLRDLEKLQVLIVERRSAQHSATHYRMPLESLQALQRESPEGDPDRTPMTALSESRPDIQGIQTGHTRSPDRTPVSPKTSLRRPEASKGRDDAAAPDALPRAVAAPRGVDTSAWARLLAGRPDLKHEDLADAAAVHLAAGCPAEALSQAMEVLRVTPHHRSLDPRYRRATSRKTNAANRGKAATPTPEQERADVVRRLSLVRVRHDTPEQELIRKQFLRVEHSLGLRAEKDRCAERIRREFPEHAPWIAWTRKAPTDPWPPVSDALGAAMLQALEGEYRAIADGVNARARAAKARRAAS